MTVQGKEIAARNERQVEAFAQDETGPIVDAYLAMIERLARDPNADVAKIERMFQLRESLLDKERERAFNTAMVAVQKVMPQVVRDAENSHTKSNYARLETISAAIKPIITDHGFSLSFDTEDSPHQGHYRVVATCAHREGFSRRYHADLPVDIAGSQGTKNKTAIQAFGSTVSYGRRYLTLMVFDVSLKNEDDDGAHAGNGEAISAAQTKNLQAMIDETHSDARLFCKFFRIEALPDLPASRYAEAVAKLEQKQKARTKP